MTGVCFFSLPLLTIVYKQAALNGMGTGPTTTTGAREVQQQQRGWPPPPRQSGSAIHTTRTGDQRGDQRWDWETTLPSPTRVYFLFSYSTDVYLKIDYMYGAKTGPKRQREHQPGGPRRRGKFDRKKAQETDVSWATRKFLFFSSFFFLLLTVLFRYYFELFDNHNDDDGMAHMQGDNEDNGNPNHDAPPPPLAHKRKMGVILIFILFFTRDSRRVTSAPFRSQTRSEGP